jgi:PAS domain S-box-containing protein
MNEKDKTKEELIEEIRILNNAKEGLEKLLGNYQEVQNKMTALINSIPIEVWFVDMNNKFTLVNPQILISEFGLKEIDEIKAEKFIKSFEVYRSDMTPRPIEEDPSLRAIRGEEVRNEEEILRIPSSGELRYRLVSASAVKDKTGSIIGGVATVRDVTERKKLEREFKERLREMEIFYKAGMGREERIIELKKELDGLKKELEK